MDSSGPLRDGDGRGRLALRQRRAPRTRPSVSIAVPSRLPPDERPARAGKALRRAIKDVFGEYALVHPAIATRKEISCDLIPERDRPGTRVAVRAAGWISPRRNLPVPMLAWRADRA